MTDPGDAEDLQRVSENRRYVLAEADHGYGIWQVHRPSDDPIAVFDEDGDGFAAADAEFRRRTRQMRLFAQLPEVLARIVAVGVIAWFLMVTLWLLRRAREEPRIA